MVNKLSLSLSLSLALGIGILSFGQFLVIASKRGLQLHQSIRRQARSDRLQFSRSA